MGIGDGDWGWGIGPNPKSPIPNPQSPIPNPQTTILKYKYFYNLLLKKLIIKINNNLNSINMNDENQSCEINSKKNNII